MVRIVTNLIIISIVRNIHDIYVVIHIGSASNEPSIQEYKYKLLACMDNGGDLINENTNKIRLEINNIEYQINEADFLYKVYIYIYI